MSTPAQNRRLLAGNWKMNLDYQAGLDLAKQCIDGNRKVAVPMVFCAPAIHLKGLNELVATNLHIYTAGQDVSSHESGAHTGEISASQLKSVGCNYVIIGHSERRSDHGETGKILANKVDQALANELKPIYCFGETLEQREAGKAQAIVTEQLTEGISQLDAAAMENVVLAYEPVWAIGTGKTASPEEAQEMHAFIRNWLRERFGESRAEQTTILYGGSVKPSNAAELFGQQDIDGGLIGGASLNADDFLAILNSFE